MISYKYICSIQISIACKTCICSLNVLYARPQVTAVETVAEMKVFGSADICPMSSESMTKPPPFKDCMFMVRTHVLLNLHLPLVGAGHSASTMYFLFALFIWAAFRDRWSCSGQKEPNVEESQTNPGFGADFTLEVK